MAHDQTQAFSHIKQQNEQQKNELLLELRTHLFCFTALHPWPRLIVQLFSETT